MLGPIETEAGEYGDIGEVIAREKLGLLLLNAADNDGGNTIWIVGARPGEAGTLPVGDHSHPVKRGGSAIALFISSSSCV